MRDTRMRAGRGRRVGTAGVVLGATAALVLSGLSASPAFAETGETVVGTPYSDTPAYMTVTPGTQLDPSAPNTVTLQGFNYDPTRAVYVGLGENLVPTKPEQWRRSAGGFSGPDGDYNYGAPRLVVANGSDDAGVADSEMDADGNWTLSVSVPGSQVESFFGGTIDCLAGNGCGFFSFGAHGRVHAGSEAYVGVSFADPVVNAAPQITAQPTAATVAAGEPASFAVTATGTPEPTFQWQRADSAAGDFADVAGETSAVLAIAAAAAGDTGAQFRVVVTNSEGSVTSDAAELTVSASPEVPGTPGSTTGYGVNQPVGQAAPSLTVTPGTGLAADGSQTVTLTGANYATKSDAGLAFGGAYTLFGAVTLQDTSDPGSWAPSKRGVSGVHYDYAGEAGVYQLMVNYPGSTTEPGMPVMDAAGNWTLTNHQIPAAQFTSQAGQTINCLAANTQCGFMTIGAHGQRSSGVEVFTPVQFAQQPAGIAPAIVTQPAGTTVDAGADASFSVLATGTPEPTYQWQRAAAGADEFADVADATAATLTVSAADAAQSGDRFRVVVSNSAGSITSEPATLTVTVAAATETTTRVADQSRGEYAEDFAGEELTLRASVTPAAAGTIEFFADGQSLGSAAVADGAAEISTKALKGGANSVTAAFSPAQAAEFTPSVSAANVFRIVDLEPAVSEIVVGDAVRTITGAELGWTVANYVSFGSAPAKEVLGGDVVLAALPESPTVTDRANRQFLFSAGSGHEDAAGNRVINFTGEVRLTSGTLPEWNFRAPQLVMNAAGNGYLTATVDGKWNGTILGGADETYGPKRVVVQTFIGAQPVSADGATSFTVSPLFEGQVAAGTWAGSYSGATMTNQFVSLVNSGVRSYFTQSGGSADPTKAGAPISVAFDSGVSPAVSVSENVSVIEDDEVIVTAVATGDPAPELQWQRLVDGDWQDIAGATSEQLVIAQAALSDAGSYRAVATNAFGTTESAAVEVSVAAKQAAGITLAPTAQSAREGNSATFRVQVSGTPAPTLQWQQLIPGAELPEDPATDAPAARTAAAVTLLAAADEAWEDIPGATSDTLVISDLRLEQNGTQYRVVASNGVGDPVISDAVTLTVTERADPRDPETEGPGTEGPGTDGPETEQPGVETPGTNQPGTTSGTNAGTATAAQSGAGLAQTGAELPLGAAALAALLLAAGAVLVLRRRAAHATPAE